MMSAALVAVTCGGRKLNAVLYIVNRVVVTSVTKAAWLPKVVKNRLITPN